MDARLDAIHRHAWGLTSVSAEVLFPAIPSLAASFTEELLVTFARLRRAYDEEQGQQLLTAMQRHFQQSFAASPRARVKVLYETEGLDGLRWRVIELVPEEADDTRDFARRAALPLFREAGQRDPLRDLLSALGAAKDVRCLDVGAGDGRAALALARLGHPVDAIEPVASLAAALERAAAQAKVQGKVVRGDFADGARLPQPRYRFAILSGLAARFRGVSPMRRALNRLASLVEPGGLVVIDVLVADADFDPEPLHRELAEAAFCPLYTRAQIDAAAYGTGFDLAIDLDDYGCLVGESTPSRWAIAAFGEGAVPFRMHRLVYRRA